MEDERAKLRYQYIFFSFLMHMFGQIVQTQQQEQLQRFRARVLMARRKRQQYYLRSARQRQRRFLVLILSLAAQHSHRYSSYERSVWKKPRFTDLWRDVEQHWTDMDWMSNIRMSKRTFDYICRELTPYLERSHTQLRYYQFITNVQVYLSSVTQ